MAETKGLILSNHDWMCALQVHLCYKSATLKSPDQVTPEMIAIWLNDNCPPNKREVSKTEVSKLHKSDEQVPQMLKPVLTKMKSLIPVTAISKHLANMRHRSLALNKFESTVSADLEGIFLGKRFSFSNPGSVNVSLFKFGRGKSGAADKSKGRPYFKEKRLIKQDDYEYQIRTRGIWLFDRGAYSLHGMSYQLKTGLLEREASIADIGPVYEDHYYLNDDKNPNLYRGIVPFIMTDGARPCATEIILEKVTDQKNLKKFWDDAEKNKVIGIRESTPAESKTLRLTTDRKYRMPIVNSKR